MNNINTQYYFRANVANSLKAFDGETISGYCAAIYNSSAPFSHLECNNDKLNLLGEEEYSQDTLSVIRVNNFDPTALNDKDSIFAKVAYADYYGATSDDISDEDEPWLQAFNIGAVYNADRIRAQIDATEKYTDAGWLLWNAANRYTGAGLKVE